MPNWSLQFFFVVELFKYQEMIWIMVKLVGGLSRYYLHFEFMPIVKCLMAERYILKDSRGVY